MKKLGVWITLLALYLSFASVGFAEQSAQSATSLYISIGGEALTDAEMASIAAMNTGNRYENW